VALSVTVALLVAGCAKENGQETIVIGETATTNEPMPQLGPSEIALLDHNASTSVDAQAVVINPDTDEPTTVMLTPHRPDGQVDYGPTASSKITQAVAEVEKLVSAGRSDAPLDLLSTMATAARTSVGPATMFLISSGVSTAGGLDLRQVGWEDGPQTLAAALGEKGLIPRLSGWDVIYTGLGDTQEPQAPLELPQRAALSSYYLAICRASGAASCEVDQTLRDTRRPNSTTPEPTVAVPEPTTVVGPGGATTTRFPTDSLGFAFDSARLGPGADAQLEPSVAQAIASQSIVTVAGTASPEAGTGSYNQWLSQARSEAVAKAMQSLGLPASQLGSVTGLGTNGVPASDCIVGGQIDEVVCSQYRTVVVTLTPPRG